MALRYQVPQFIDIEDKIIGPLTLKQFLLFFSAVLALIPVYLFSDLSLFVTLALPVLAVAAAFAFLKPGGKSLFQLIINMVNFLLGGQMWVWRRTAAKPKAMEVTGPEIQTRPEAPFWETPPPSLQRKMQAIETEGNVSETDLEDPFAESTDSKAQVPNKTQ